MSDEQIKDMASLLRKGATMLDKYCPQCNGILFRLRNNSIFCPKCQKEVVIVKENSKILENTRRSENKAIKTPRENGAKHPSSLELEDIFLSKLKELSNKLLETEDQNLLKKILNNIDKLVSLIEKIRKF